MDTDDLSTEAHKAILIEAEKFNHDLTLRFGLLSYKCDTEKEYLDGAKILIQYIRNSDSHDLSDMFFGSPPNRKSLNKVLDKILVNISEVEKIPEKKRHYDF